MNGKIKGLMLAAPAFVASVASAAEGDIDMTAVTDASTKITTALTTWFTNTLTPFIVAIGGLALVAYLILALFKWARKLGK